MASFDIGTWYQILYAGTSPSSFGTAFFSWNESLSLATGEVTATNQQWQILPSTSWRASNPVFLLRNRYEGDEYYFRAYCENLHNCTGETRPRMNQATVETKRLEYQWQFKASRTRPETYNIMNLANGTSWILNGHAYEIMRMTNNSHLSNTSWVALPLGSIEDDRFLTFPVCSNPSIQLGKPCFQSKGLSAAMKGVIALVVVLAIFGLMTGILFRRYRRLKKTQMAEIQQAPKGCKLPVEKSPGSDAERSLMFPPHFRTEPLSHPSDSVERDLILELPTPDGGGDSQHRTD